MLLMFMTVTAELHSDPLWGDPILWHATEKYNGFLLHGKNNWKSHLEVKELNLNVIKDHSHLLLISIKLFSSLLSSPLLLLLHQIYIQICNRKMNTITTQLLFGRGASRDHTCTLR